MLSAEVSDCDNKLLEAYATVSGDAFSNYKDISYSSAVLDSLILNLHSQLRIIKQKAKNQPDATEESVLQTTATPFIIGFIGILEFTALKINERQLSLHDRVQIHFFLTKLLQDVLDSILKTGILVQSLLKHLLEEVKLTQTKGNDDARFTPEFPLDDNIQVEDIYPFFNLVFYSLIFIRAYPPTFFAQ